MSGIELEPCPNPWCEAAERKGDYSPVVRLHHFGNYRAVCTSCLLEGPLRPNKAEAAAAWNTRSQSERERRLEEALKPFAEAADKSGDTPGDYNLAYAVDVGILLEVDDLRRARSALNPSPEGSGNAG